MKTLPLIPILFLIISCRPKTESGASLKKEYSSVSNISLRRANLENKVFEFGSKTHFTDSCSFYFECDCCSGELLFGRDSTFYYLDHCMSDETARKGIYFIENGQLKLEYGKQCVSRKYNYQNELDTSAVDYFISDTLVKEFSITYSASICENKIKLTDPQNKYYGIETNSTFEKNIQYLKENGFF